MGWLYTKFPSWCESKDAYLRHQCRISEELKPQGYDNTVLKSAFVGTTWYAAVELKRPDAPTRVVAFVFLTRTSGGEFGYKDMDETVGPNEDRCPLSIMKLLTPVQESDGYAADWRERVYAYHAAQKAAKNLEEEMLGKVIAFDSPLQFGFGQVAGGKLERVAVGRARRQRLVIRANGFLCAVSKENLRTAKVVEAA